MSERKPRQIVQRRPELTTNQREFLWKIWDDQRMGLPGLFPTSYYKSRCGERLVQLKYATRSDVLVYKPDGAVANRGRPRPCYSITEAGSNVLWEISCPRCYSIYSSYVRESHVRECSQCEFMWPANTQIGISDVAV